MKILGGLLAVAAALILAAPSVSAQYPPTGDVTLSVAEASVPQGGTVNLTATGFSGEVDFTMFSDPHYLGSSVADANGVAKYPGIVPADAELVVHRVIAEGINMVTGQPDVAEASFLVTGVGVLASSAENPLARTGSNTWTLARIGTVMVAVGGVFVLAVRRRRAGPTIA